MIERIYARIYWTRFILGFSSAVTLRFCDEVSHVVCTPQNSIVNVLICIFLMLMVKENK